MISKISLIFILSLLGLNASAFREVRNGGGGVKIDGRYLTFQSAKIPVTATAEKPMAIPGLQYLITRISNLPVDDTMKGQLILNIWATSARKYYRVPNSAVDPLERAKIVAEYSELMKIPADSVALFAITSPEANATLLLPEFFELREPEQAAILLHESLWIWKPHSTYHSVVAVEQSAQAYFESRTSQNFYNFVYQIGQIANSPRFAISAALNYDLAQNKMGPTAVIKKRVPLRDLLGANFIKGLLTRVDAPLNESKLPEFAASAISEAANDSISYPENTFYFALLDFLQTGGFISLSGFIPLEETTLMAPPSELLRNKIFRSQEEITDYMNQLYLDFSKSSNLEPLRYRLVNPNGQVLGSVVFF
jgi:hypothetical protein